MGFRGKRLRRVCCMAFPRFYGSGRQSLRDRRMWLWCSCMCGGLAESAVERGVDVRVAIREFSNPRHRGRNPLCRNRPCRCRPRISAVAKSAR